MKKQIFLLFIFGCLLINFSSAVTIQLQDADIENLDDSYVWSINPDTNFGGNTTLKINATDSMRIYIKFNISQLLELSDISVDDARIFLYRGTGSSTSNDIIKNYHIYNQTWTEEGITWNNQPCGSSFDDSLNCNLTNEDSREATDDVFGWFNLFVKNMLILDYNSGKANFSIAIRDIGQFGATSSFNYNSKEYETSAVRPYLNITYTSISPNVTLNQPSNNNFTSSTTINFNCSTTDSGGNLKNITLYGNWSGGWHSNETVSISGSSNSSTFSKTISEGNYVWNCLSYDNNTNSDFGDSNFTLTIDTTYPLISYGTGVENNNTNFSRTWIFSNVSIIETNFKNLTFYLYNTSLVNSTTFADSTRSLNFTNLADGLYYYNVTTYDDAENSNSTPTYWIRLDNKAPALTLTRPQTQTYGTNLSLPINYTVSDVTTGIDSCWYKVVNSTGSVEINNVSLANCGNSTFNVSRSDTYTLTLYANDSLNQLNSSVVIFSVSLIAPAVVLDYPTNNTVFSAININRSFNFTATDSDGLSQCQLWGNWTGSWHNNYTWISPTNATQNYTYVNFTSDVTSVWNVWCNDTFNNGNWALNNLTFYVDTTKPFISINSITTTVGSQTISFNSTETDATLSTCKYSIYNSSNGIDGTNENISMTCNSNPHSATVTAYGTYTLRVYALDLASNENYSELAFTTSASSGGTTGGGGGGSPAGLISVIAMTIPSNYSELVSNLNRAKIYARIRDSCLNFSSLDSCSLTDEEKALTIDTLSKQEISLTLEQFNLFFTDFINNKFEELKVSEEDADKFDLFKATLNIATSDFAVTPRTLDQYFLFFSKTPHKILITSNKILSNVSLVSGELGLSANLKTLTTAEITYTPQSLDFTARTIKGKVNYISENGESLFQDVQIRAINLKSPTIIGGVLLILLIITITTIFLKRKSKKNGLFA